MPSSKAREMRALVQAFIRRFGLLEEGRTPCGKPLPTSRAHALMELLGQSGLRQGELGERLGLSKSGASRLVATLVESGHVKRVPDEEDGRAYRLQLTARGRHLAEQVDRSSHLRFEALTAAIPDSQHHTVCEALQMLVAAAGVCAKPHEDPHAPDA